MKKFYLVMLDAEPVRIFTEKVDADKWVVSMAEFGYSDYTIMEVEGY